MRFLLRSRLLPNEAATASATVPCGREAAIFAASAAVAGRLGPELAPAAAAFETDRGTEPLSLPNPRSGVSVRKGERARGETELVVLAVSEGPYWVDGPGWGALGFGCMSVSAYRWRQPALHRRGQDRQRSRRSDDVCSRPNFRKLGRGVNVPEYDGARTWKC